MQNATLMEIYPGKGSILFIARIGRVILCEWSMKILR